MDGGDGAWGFPVLFFSLSALLALYQPAESACYRLSAVTFNIYVSRMDRWLYDQVW